MNRWFVISGLVILVLALGLLTQGVRKAAPTEAQAQQDAQAAQQAKAKQNPPPLPNPPAPKASPAEAPAAASGAAGPPAEETVGDPVKARHHIEVGWIYEEGSAPNADKLNATLDEVRQLARKSGGSISAEIVDLDMPAEDRSPAAQGVTDLGVTVDGQTVSDGNPADAAPGSLAAALGGAIR